MKIFPLRIYGVAFLAVMLVTPLFVSSAWSEQAFAIIPVKAGDHTPSDDVRKTIRKNESALLRYVLAGHQEGLDGLLADAFSYLHENGRVSNKQDFFDNYLTEGYIDARLDPYAEMQQYGNMVSTIHYGHFRLKSEGEYPKRSVVTHIWCKTAEGDWALVHRGESHGGYPLNNLLPQNGEAVNLENVGAKPEPKVAKIIAKLDAEWSRSMVENDAKTMDGIMDESVRYVHVVDLISDKERFMWEQSTGFTKAEFKDSIARQFGNTVVVLHKAHYRHTGAPDQSRSQVMHCYVKFGDDWRMVVRHGTRFLPY